MTTLRLPDPDRPVTDCVTHDSPPEHRAQLPTPTSPAWEQPGVVDTIAAGLPLAEPVVVLTPEDGSPSWRMRCSICGQTRAEDALWEEHYYAWRVEYYQRIGLAWNPAKCGGCGAITGAGAVQKDGLRFCNPEHAAPYEVVVYEPDWWLELVGVLPSASGAQSGHHPPAASTAAQPTPGEESR